MSRASARDRAGMFGHGDDSSRWLPELARWVGIVSGACGLPPVWRKEGDFNAPPYPPMTGGVAETDFPCLPILLDSLSGGMARTVGAARVGYSVIRPGVDRSAMSAARGRYPQIHLAARVGRDYRVWVETRYNENDPKAAAWLRELIRRGHLPDGAVDERSIEDLTGDDCAETMHFFAGIGGWPYALRLAGWPEDVPVWTGSCPCQPFSTAAAGKQRGTDDERHLWPAFHRLIAERRPAIVFGEQIANASTLEWLAQVRSDLESIGYAVGAGSLCASVLGFPRRRRLFFAAHAHGDGQRNQSIYEQVARIRQTPAMARINWRELRRDFQDLDGLPAGVGFRRRGYGNAIVPQVAALFVRAFMESLAARGGRD